MLRESTMGRVDLTGARRVAARAVPGLCKLLPLLFVACLARAEPIESSGVQQVLHRAQFLEERRVDADPVDQPLDGHLVPLDIVAEDFDPAVIVPPLCEAPLPPDRISSCTSDQLRFDGPFPV